MKTVLLLGGTTEGYELAQALAELGTLRVVSSLAGRTQNPRLPAGEVRIGGFGGIEGLRDYLSRNRIDAVIDATHPFAGRMGWNAANAAALANVPLLRLERPAWQAGPGDRWHCVQDWTQAAQAVERSASRVLLAIGRQELEHFAHLERQWFLIRTVDRPDPPPAFAQYHLLLAKGPFTLDGERQLLVENRIDAIVCKNSGGTATDAKLSAARELGIGVVMLDRPQRPPTAVVSTTAAAMDWVTSAV